MAIDFSLQPLPASNFGFKQARHLLARAGLGGSADQVQALVDRGLEGAVDLLVNYEQIDASSLPAFDVDPDIMHPPTPEERERIRQARQRGDTSIEDQIRAERNRRDAMDRGQQHRLEQWWLGRMISTGRPLEENLVLLWHDHFASHYRNVRDSYLMYQQNEFFRRSASSSFADLARGIVHDPAMLIFLNNNNSNRRKPNENLARELMELFTLGVGHYTEQDIKEGARALTGFSVDDNDFIFRRGNHDDGEKTILGQKGKHDGDAFVNLLLQRDDCPRFVAHKLYNHFVADLDDLPADRYEPAVNQLAALVHQHDYQLKPVLQTLFSSRHFYDPAVIGNKIKNPVQLLVGTLRTLRTPVRDLSVLTSALEMMGQELFSPPSVAGWDEGRAWINTSTLYVRQNTTVYLLTGKLPYSDGWRSSDINYDPLPLVADLPVQTPQTVADHLLKTLIAVEVSPTRKKQLVQTLEEAVERDGRGLKAGTVLGALLLITAMPEYQLC